jgi:hypothetical protein
LFKRLKRTAQGVVQRHFLARRLRAMNFIIIIHWACSDILGERITQMAELPVNGLIMSHIGHMDTEEDLKSCTPSVFTTSVRFPCVVEFFKISKLWAMTSLNGRCSQSSNGCCKSSHCS